MIRKFIFVVFLVSLSACASGKRHNDNKIDVIEAYNAAKVKLDNDEFAAAVNLFERAEIEHPGSYWAKKARVMQAYSYYLNKDYDSAIAVLENFLKLHPADPYAPYALYLKSMCLYLQVLDVAHEQSVTYEAVEALQELISKFPKSIYATDASERMVILRNRLAGKEMDVGRFYLHKNNLIAAMNRFKTVIDDKDNIYYEEALYRMVEIFTAMKMVEEAEKYHSILSASYPEGKWYKFAKKLVRN